MKNISISKKQKGVTLIELLVAMAIGLVIVITVTGIYINTSGNQRASERRNDSLENGLYVLQLLGRDIMNAGFYPATHSPESTDLLRFPKMVMDATKKGMYDTYPPLPSDPRKETDWMDASKAWPPAAYVTGIFGCEGGEFDVKTATCPPVNSEKPDSLVVNYFTNDVMGNAGRRKDCNGAAVDNDPSNVNRTTAKKDFNSPPLLPLFVSNRYSVRDLKNYVDNLDVLTRSLFCAGNGASISSYQPIISGINSLKLQYGVYDSDTNMTPKRFYKASEVSSLPEIKISGRKINGWQRVTSVRVCVLSQSQGGGVRLSDQGGEEKTYKDCDDQLVKQPSGQWIDRFVQVFGVRNGLKQSY